MNGKEHELIHAASKASIYYDKEIASIIPMIRIHVNNDASDKNIYINYPIGFIVIPDYISQFENNDADILRIFASSDGNKRFYDIHSLIRQISMILAYVYASYAIYLADSNVNHDYVKNMLTTPWADYPDNIKEMPHDMLIDVGKTMMISENKQYSVRPEHVVSAINNVFHAIRRKCELL